jgi:peptide/nickel transport system permease protein
VIPARGSVAAAAVRPGSLVVILAAVLFLTIFGSVLAPQNPLTINASALFQGPSAQHLLGTDYLGRDVLSRLMAGTRLSVLTALEAVGIGLVVGAPLGVATVFLGRWFDFAVNRVSDALMTLPYDLLRRGGHRGPRQRPGPGHGPGRHPAGPGLLPDHQGGDPGVRERPVRGGGTSCWAASKLHVIRVHVVRKVLPTIAVTTRP